MTQMTFARAINSGLRKSLENDPKVVLMGEDIGALGGVFRVTDGLQKDFGKHRVVDTPLAESGIMGTAVGLAYRGYRPVVEIQFDGFIYPAFDQIVSQVAKMHYRTQGAVKMPITIRVPFGGGIGSPEHHSESPEAYFTHTSGLRVVSVSNPQDAYTMIQQAIASDDPVLYFEPKRRYHDKGEVDETVDLSTALSMEKARVVTEGKDVTLVAYGPLVKTARDAATGGRRRRRLGRGHRPALAGTAGLRHPGGLGPQDRPAGHHARGRPVRRPRRRGRREHHRTLLLPPRSRPRPGDRLRRSRTRTPSWKCTTCRAWTGSSTASTVPSAAPTPSAGWKDERHHDQGIQAPGPRRRTDGIGNRHLEGRGRGYRHPQPDHRRGGDGQGRRRTALAVRRRGHGPARTARHRGGGRASRSSPSRSRATTAPPVPPVPVRTGPRPPSVSRTSWATAPSWKPPAGRPAAPAPSRPRRPLGPSRPNRWHQSAAEPVAPVRAADAGRTPAGRNLAGRNRLTRRGSVRGPRRRCASWPRTSASTSRP